MQQPSQLYSQCIADETKKKNQNRASNFDDEKYYLHREDGLISLKGESIANEAGA